MNPRFRPLIGLSLAISLFAAQSAKAADKWLRVQSPNFVFVGNGSEVQIRRIARNLEQFRAAFVVLFPGAGQKSSVGTTVLVFKDDNSFKPFKPLYEGKPKNIAGWFQSGSDANFIALNGEIETPTVIYHEFVHSLTKDATQRLPVWVSEGLAEFYSTFYVGADGKSVDMGKPIAQHIVTLREKPFIPMSAFLSVDHDSPYYNEQSKQGIFYAQSWAIVHYLMAGNKGVRRPQFSKYLSLIATGKPIDESFQEAFQTDYAGLEKELETYISAQLAWPYYKVALPEKLDVDSATQTSPLTEAQSTYYLGDLLYHTGRYDVAETQLQKAITLDPKFSGSYASMGLLRLKQDQREAALNFLTKAVENDSQNHIAHYYYASLLQRLADDQAPEDRMTRLRLMRTHLKKAIEIEPHYLASYDLLGYTALALKEELDEAEVTLDRAIKFAPGREDLKLRLAEVMLSNKQAAAARAVLTTLRNTTTDAATREQAGKLIDFVTRQLESEQLLREYEARRKADDTELAKESVQPEKTVDDGPPRLSRPTATPVETSEPATPTNKPPSDRRVQGPEVEGMLTMIDCTNGMTLHVRVGNGLVKLHSNTPTKIDFVSYLKEVKDAIACGPVKPEVHVVVVYRRSNDPSFLGEPLVVEFH